MDAQADLRHCCSNRAKTGFLMTSLILIDNIDPSHAAITISINATAAEFICKNIFLTPVQVKKIIKKKK